MRSQTMALVYRPCIVARLIRLGQPRAPLERDEEPTEIHFRTGTVDTRPARRTLFTRLSRSMRLRVPMLAGPDGFLRWWVGLGGSP
jgi:hypothetical protein